MNKRNLSSTVKFIFVHSYSSKMANWYSVMMGYKDQEGRVITAKRLARVLDVPLIANDQWDTKNHDIFESEGIENIGTALCTRDEVKSALQKSCNGCVLFVTSPDHLPRVVRDVLSLGGTGCLFASSEVSFSEEGVSSVKIIEPPHKP